MFMLVALLQQAAEQEVDLTLNYIILGVLFVIAAILFFIVVRRRMNEKDDDFDF